MILVGLVELEITRHENLKKKKRKAQILSKRRKRGGGGGGGGGGARGGGRVGTDSAGRTVTQWVVVSLVDI